MQWGGTLSFTLVCSYFHPTAHFVPLFLSQQLFLQYLMQGFEICNTVQKCIKNCAFSDQAILKILSVCCAPTDPPKSPRPKFFFRYFRFFIFFSGFPRTPIVRRKQTPKVSSNFQNNQCTPRFKRHVVYSNQLQND